MTKSVQRNIQIFAQLCAEISTLIYIILNLCVRLKSYSSENYILCPESSLPCIETVELLTTMAFFGREHVKDTGSGQATETL